MDETATIKSVIAGDVNKYEQLVNRYHIGLIIHCERIVGDRASAEDIAQEAFIKAFQELPRFDETKSRFSTWLYKIASNKSIDHLRTEKRSIPTEDIDLVAKAPAPDYEKTERIQTIRDAVSTLEPPTHRRAVEAYYWHGKSYQQIADEEKVPINTVRTWLRRAKQTLRSDLS